MRHEPTEGYQRLEADEAAVARRLPEPTDRPAGWPARPYLVAAGVAASALRFEDETASR